MSALTLVTVCDVRRAAEAWVLAQSFLAVHPDDRVLIVVADAVAVPVFDDARIEALTGRELAPEGYELLLAGLSGDALARALVPAALRHAGAPALALCPDTEVLAPIDLPVTDGVVVVATGDAAAGVVDDGAAAVVGPRGAHVLAWWEERVAAFDVDHHFEAAAARFEDVLLVRDPSWAVAAWNAEARGVWGDSDRLLLGDGSPVVWVRFDAEAGAAAASSLTQATLAHRGRVAEAERAIAARAIEVSELPDGTLMDDRLRRLFAAGVRAGALHAAPFDADGMLTFRRWLDAPGGDERGGGVSRYLFDVWLARPDLQATYPDLRDASDRHGFLGWSVVYGADELSIPGWLLPEDYLGGAEVAEASPSLGINLAGYFQSELGVGEAARRVVTALDAAHVPLLPVQSRLLPLTRRGHAYEVNSPSVGPFPFNLVCVNADGLGRFAEEVGPFFFADRHTIGMWWWELPSFPAGERSAFDHLDELWVGSSWVYDAIAPLAPIPVLKVPVAVTRPAPPERTRSELGLPEGFLVLFFFDQNSVLERKNPLGLIEAFTEAFPPGDGASLVIKTINGQLHPRDCLRLKLAASQHPNVHLVEGHVTADDRDAMISSCDLYASLHRSEGFGLTLAEAMALGRPTLATGWSGNLEFMHPETTRLVPFELVPVGEGNAPYDALSHWADPDLRAAATAMREVREEPEEAARLASAAAERLLADHDPVRVGAVMRARLEVLSPRVADRQALGHRARLRGQSTGAAVAAAAERAGIGPEEFPGSRRSLVRRGVRSGVLKASRPLAENQRAIDAALLAATREVAEEAGRLHARIDAEVTAHAELSAATLAGQRRLMAESDRLSGLEARLARLVRRADEREEQLAAAYAGLAGTQAALADQLRPLVRGAEAIPWTEGEPFAVFDHPLVGRVVGYADADAETATTSYRSFEDVFRGSRERVRGLLERYTGLLSEHAPVLDVGAGRGELLELLREAGIEASGVELDAGMASGAIELGLDVVLGDGVEHLESLEPGSLGAVTAIHVIEHLPPLGLERFLRAAHQALRPGGLLACETVNPHAGFALKTFWVDPTHHHPLFPESALVLARAAGFPAAFFTHMRGSNDVDRDRYNEDSYTLVAERASGQ